jgi:hypothetical protein
MESGAPCHIISIRSFLGISAMDKDIDAAVEQYGRVEVRFMDTMAPLPTSVRPTKEESSED